MMTIKKHVDVLDSLRAVAALSVCFFHFICTVTGFIHSPFFLGIFEYGHYGVQMFFVISGFVIPWTLFHNSYRIGHYFKFIAKRLIRLEPPYLVSLALAITHTFLRSLSPYYNGVDITPSVEQVLLHFGYLVPFVEGAQWIRPVYWTLAIEFQYYLFIGLFFHVISDRRLVLRILGYAVFLLAPLMGLGFLPAYLPIFLFGVIASLYMTRVTGLAELLVVSVLIVADLLIFSDIGSLVFSVVPFAAILLWPDYKNRVLDFIGKISYSLYLFHSLTGLVFLNYISHIDMPPVMKGVMIMIALSIAIGAAYVAYRLVEQPSKKWSSSISFKKNRS